MGEGAGESERPCADVGGAGLNFGAANVCFGWKPDVRSGLVYAPPDSPKHEKQNRAGGEQNEQNCRNAKLEITVGPGSHPRAAASFLGFGSVALGALHLLKPVG